MPDFQPSEPDSPPSELSPERPPFAARLVAAIEVLLCSDVFTQGAIGGTLNALGYRPSVNGRLSVNYVVTLSLADALLLVLLILVMLYAHGERPRDVLFGRRSVTTEVPLGLLIGVGALVIAGTVLLTIQRFVPVLHTVAQNPLQDMLRSPRDAWLFALVVLVAGGVREEIQRAFLLHRFEAWLGGPVVGVVVTSVAFGAGHLLQGADAAIATALLGAYWGIVYLRRRSCIAPMVSHGAFDLLQVAQYLGVR